MGRYFILFLCYYSTKKKKKKPGETHLMCFHHKDKLAKSLYLFPLHEHYCKHIIKVPCSRRRDDEKKTEKRTVEGTLSELIDIS